MAPLIIFMAQMGHHNTNSRSLPHNTPQIPDNNRDITDNWDFPENWEIPDNWDFPDNYLDIPNNNWDFPDNNQDFLTTEKFGTVTENFLTTTKISWLLRNSWQTFFPDTSIVRFSIGQSNNNVLTTNYRKLLT